MADMYVTGQQFNPVVFYPGAVFRMTDVAKGLQDANCLVVSSTATLVKFSYIIDGRVKTSNMSVSEAIANSSIFPADEAIDAAQVGGQ